jgi:hypothetical protein
MGRKQSLGKRVGTDVLPVIPSVAQFSFLYVQHLFGMMRTTSFMGIDSLQIS